MNEETKKQDDEISLIDLFAVLLRYRKMICAVLLFAVVVIIAGYFVYPSLQKEKNKIVETYETMIPVNISPGARFFLLNTSSQSYAAYFIHPEVIQAVLEDVQKTSPLPQEVLQWTPVLKIPVNGDDRNYESANKKLLIKDNIRGNVLEITYNGDDPQSGIIFLQSLFLHCSLALENYIMPLAETFIQTYESASLNNDNITNYLMVKALVDGKSNVLVQLYDPYVMVKQTVTKSMRYRYLALVILFAAVFFSVILAFCLNAIKNLKADQQAMAKLKAAMGRSDKQ